LDYPDKEAPDTAYLEADATYISLQKKGQEKGGKLEVKLGVGYTGCKFQPKSTPYFTPKVHHYL